MEYSSIVFGFDVSKESRIAEIGFATGTNIISIIGIIPASPPIPMLIIIVNGCREHNPDFNNTILKI